MPSLNVEPGEVAGDQAERPEALPAYLFGPADVAARLEHFPRLAKALGEVSREGM